MEKGGGGTYRREWFVGGGGGGLAAVEVVEGRQFDLNGRLGGGDFARVFEFVHAGAQRVYFSLQRGDFGAQGDRLLFAGRHFRPQRQQFLFQRQQQRGGGGVIVMMVVVVMVMMLWTTYKRTSRQQSSRAR